MIDSPILPIRAPQDNVVHLEHARMTQDRWASEITANGSESFPACAELYRYWQDLRGTRQMPARSEFDPRSIETALAATFVAEKVATSVARIRVAGSVLNETLGMDVRGMPITALFDPTARDCIAEATRDLFTGPAMVVLELRARTGFHRNPLRARMVLLPMSDAQGNIALIIGCLDIQGGLGKTPRRFKITSMRRTDVTGESPVAIAETPLYPTVSRSEAMTETYAFAEEATVFRSKRLDDKDIPA